MTEQGEFKNRLKELGLVKVGEPCECGWFEKEGFKDDWLAIDDDVVVDREEVYKVLDEAKKEIFEDVCRICPFHPALCRKDCALKKWFGSDGVLVKKQE